MNVNRQNYINPIKSKGKKNISIRTSTVIAFSFAISIIIALVGYVVFSNWKESVMDTMTEISEDMNQKINDQIDSMLMLPEHINESNQKFIANHIVDLKDESERDRFFAGVLQTYQDEIYSFTYGSNNGEYYGARTNKNGKLELINNNKITQGQSWYYETKNDLTKGKLVMKTDAFDPRTRNWYIAAKKRGEPTFSSVYKHFVINDLTISAAWPIYDQKGELQGVLGAHMLLSKLNKFLMNTTQGKDGYALIYEKESGSLIANSFQNDNFTIGTDSTFIRYTVEQLDHTIMNQAYQKYNKEKASEFTITQDGANTYFRVTEFKRPGLDWIVITGVSNRSFINDINHNIRITILIVGIALTLSVMLYFALINKLYQPLNHLVEAAEKISSGDLDQRVEVKRRDEIGVVASSFNHMALKMNQFVNELESKVKERTFQLEQSNDDLNKTKDNLSLILDSTAEGIFGLDPDGYCTFCNDSGVKMLGYESQDEILGTHLTLKIHKDNVDGQYKEFEDCHILKALYSGSEKVEAEAIYWRKDGSCFDVEYHSYPQLKDGEVIGTVVTFFDITLRKKGEEQIKYLISHDYLTGMLNRMGFEEELKRMDVEDNLPISILFADMNGLKLMNDVFGHSLGDKLIKKSAQLLKDICQENNVAARVGGDEFILLLPKTDAKTAQTIVHKIKERLDNEQIHAVKCSMAMGFDTKIHSYQKLEKIMGNAESEMYLEKLRSKNQVGETMITTIMNTLQHNNPKSKEHAEQVAMRCEAIGKALSLSETDLKKLRNAAYLHDIGKITLDKELLNRITLSEKEMQEIHQHPAMGYRILNIFDSTMDLADGVYCHHEWWDGTGYPRGLKGKEIPLIARIIALVEGYEELLLSDESHQKSKQDMINELRYYAGKRFEPTLVEEFIKILE